MKAMNNDHFKEIENLSWLRQNYFSNPDQKMELKKGDEILHQGKSNDKLLYVESGKLSGYYRHNNGDEMKIFSTRPKMCAGIYSFFSPDDRSYTTVRAEEDSIIFFVRKDQIPSPSSEPGCLFLRHVLPVLVNEIYIRQMLSVQTATEKQAAMEKLYQSDKLALLGQLAAGLAHELNNAIGVIHSKTQWLTQQLQERWSNDTNPAFTQYFEKGLKSGQALSTKEVRLRKKKLTDKLNTKIAARLAKIDMSDLEMNEIVSNFNENYIDKLESCWEIGSSLHDMNIASDHTAHVIKSIKELGASDHVDVKTCDLNASISKSLALLSSVTKTVEIDLNLEPNLSLIANEGKLIQVWVNLIKNAAEALTQSQIDNPKITICSQSSKKSYQVTIEDNGPGIQEELLPTIFQPNVTTKISGMSFGLGLGLAIVQQIVVHLGGHIKVDSAQGKTTFTVIIPKP